MSSRHRRALISTLSTSSSACGAARTPAHPRPRPDMAVNEWATDAHALAYLERRAHLPRRDEAAAELIARLPGTTRRVLDLGTGDGTILALVLDAFPQATGMAVYFSPAMLDAERQRFAGVGCASCL